MSKSKEFKINDYITLKLENGQTNIYVGKTYFRQCAFLFIHPAKFLDNDFKSIDEIADFCKKDLEGKTLPSDFGLTEKDLFWGHSSNLQAWFEHQYDTRLLDSKLSFPLLKELTIAGDPLAKNVFKEEIIKRLSSGYSPVVNYLIEEGYDSYLTEDELLSTLLDASEHAIIKKLKIFMNDIASPIYAKSKKISIEEGRRKLSLDIVPEILNLPMLLGVSEDDITDQIKKDPFGFYFQNVSNIFAVRNKYVVRLRLFFPRGVKFPIFISELKGLEILEIDMNFGNEFPEYLYTLRDIKSLKRIEIFDLKINSEQIRKIYDSFEAKNIKINIFN